jgi:hypothetical protein
MKFYNRENEIKLLNEIRKASKQSAKMTIIVGRRRIGKTSLALKVSEKAEYVYLFVSRKNEILLCTDFIEEIKRALKINIYGEFRSIKSLFGYLMELSEKKHFTLIFDEFQEFGNINPSIFSDMQQIWDRNKNKSRVNLIISGSIYTLMKKIFENSKEPLFGRANEKIYLKPLSVDTIKEIYKDYYPSYSKFDLLSFYTITGGVAKYVELLADKNAFSYEGIINELIRENSFWLDEGKNLLIEEFGKDYITYFSILSLLAASKTSRSEIESILEKNIGGYLDRLINDYRIVKPVKPVLAKPGSRIQKYFIEDNFLNFWFRFIFKNKNAVEIGNYEYIKEIIKRDFRTYTGKYLEKWFIEKLKLSGKYSEIGTYWDKGENEIDIVALNQKKKEILIGEVKLRLEKLSEAELREKAKKIEQKFFGFKFDYKLFSLNEM